MDVLIYLEKTIRDSQPGGPSMTEIIFPAVLFVDVFTRVFHKKV